MICECCNKEVTFITVPVEDRMDDTTTHITNGKRVATEDINDRAIKKQRLCIDIVVSVVIHR
jgi:hypothetical protein